MSNENRVDVIGIGTQRSASTWVFNALDSHPDVSTGEPANNKELNFFNCHYQRGYDWYHGLFEDRTPPCAEYSVLYWIAGDVPERIHRYNPDAKLILTVRDPVDRVRSQHRHQYRRGRLPDSDPSLSRALEQNPTYVKQGRYATHLKRFLKYFNRSSVKILLLEDILNEPENTVEELYDFLDINRQFRPNHLRTTVNRSKAFRFDFLKELRFSLATGLRSTLGDWSVDLIKKTSLPSLLRQFNEQSAERELPAPDPATLDQLRKTFRPEVREFAKLIGRDLSHWLEAP